MPLADQIPDHRLPGRDPDPGLQPAIRSGLQSRDRLDQRKPRAHRPLGIVLVRLRPAEVPKHAVAQVLSHVALKPLDHWRMQRDTRA